MAFENKVVLVTGASSGVGAATARLFAARGARLALVGRAADRLRAVADACAEERGRPPLAIVADLATDEGCERAAKDTLDHFGRLDILINNAGAGCRMNLGNADMATFDAMFNTNVRGAFNLTRLLMSALVNAKGNIVNVSSVATTMGLVGSLPYGMAKAALDFFTRLITIELAPKGVRVNAVSPGITATDFRRRMKGSLDEELFLETAVDMIPMGRVNSPEHVAKMIVFLAGEDCELVTGNVVKIDGGMELISVLKVK